MAKAILTPKLTTTNKQAVIGENRILLISNFISTCRLDNSFNNRLTNNPVKKVYKIAIPFIVNRYFARKVSWINFLNKN